MAITIKLSVLICSLDSRREMCRRLVEFITKQVDPSFLQIYVYVDNGELSIGEKRNRLVKGAVGDYISFVDDDDWVSDNYVSLILDAIRSNPDCCSLNGVMTTNGGNSCRFVHSLSCKSWHEKGSVYYRTPNHLNAIKRSIVLQVPFPNSDYGEDKSFSDAVKPLLHSEVKITDVLYYYRYKSGG